MPEPTALLEDSAAYVEQHKVFQLFETLLQQLLIDRPDDPVDHLIRVLKRDAMPKIVVSGPPGAEIRSLCELLAAKTDLVHVVAADLPHQQAKLQTEAGLQAKGLKDAGADLPDSLMLALLKEKLTSADCVTKGWVLEGFPTTGAQARALQAEGLLPTRFLHVAVSDSEVMRRLTGRRIDPETRKTYHMEDEPPPDAETSARVRQRDEDAPAEVQARLATYRRDMQAVLPAFSTVLKEIDGTAPMPKLLELAIPLITSEMPTRAPRGCPRVLLLGGPGSNADALGAALAQRYSVKYISALDLLHSAALNNNKGAMKCMETSEPLRAAESIIGPLVLARLTQEDVRTSGFVLAGYPATSQQAAFLAKKGIWVRHAVHLDLSPAEAEAAVLNARYDPFDGEAYHLDGHMPADPENVQRLVPHPKNSKAVVTSAIKAWHAAKPAVLKAYTKELLTEDAKRPLGQLVERLAACFLSL